MEYKGYHGKVDFDEEAEIFHGEVINVKDVFTFEGRSVEQLKQAFRDSVDDSLVLYGKRYNSRLDLSPYFFSLSHALKALSQALTWPWPALPACCSLQDLACRPLHGLFLKSSPSVLKSRPAPVFAFAKKRP